MCQYTHEKEDMYFNIVNIFYSPVQVSKVKKNCIFRSKITLFPKLRGWYKISRFKVNILHVPKYLVFIPLSVQSVALIFELCSSQRPSASLTKNIKRPKTE